MIKTLVLKITFPLYIIVMAFLTWTGVKSHLYASSVLEDHQVVSAPMELTGTSSRTKRGHTSTTYKFKYTYEVAGKSYTGYHSAVNDYGEGYLENPVIDVAYATGNPDKAGLLHTLQRQRGIGSLIKRLMIAGAIIGFLALALYGWAMPDDEEDEEDAEPAPAAS